MQFSVAAHQLCMLGCVLLDCNGTKWTGNALTNPPAACSQQLLREARFQQVAISFLFLSFQAMIWMYLWQISPKTMLWLTCRDFQMEFWSFYLKNCVCHVKEYALTCGSCAQLTCSIQCGNLDALWEFWLTCVCHRTHLPYTFYHTCLTDFRLKLHVLEQKTVLPYMLYRTRFKRLQIGIGTLRGSNYPLAVLCQDLGLFTLLAAVLWIEEGGWWGGPFQAFWSSWVEHHARLVQGLSNWQVWAASPPATFVLHLEFRVQFWLLHSCVQFVVSADWEAQGKRVPSP